MKNLKNNKGSTLILLVFVIAILSILGTTLMGITMTNYKMKLVNSKAKQSFYMSEAGLEEAYANVCNLVNDAGTQATSSAAVVMANFSYEEELLKEVSGEGSDFIKEIKDEENNIKYIVDEEAIASRMNNVFKTSFKKTIDDNIKNTLENTSIESNSIKPSIAAIPSEFKDDKMDIDVKSTFVKEGVKRSTKAILTINVPEYNEPYYVEKKSVQIPYNPVWTKALCADKNIYINSGDVVISGDIYASGTDTNGIIVQNNENKFQVKGKTITKRNIVFNNSNLSVNLGDRNKLGTDVYSKNILLNDNAANSKLNIFGSVYVPDDLEINGLNQKVLIGGNFYGFSDGSEINAKHNQSSGIIINSDDLGKDGTSLTISGQAIIYGTSYIDTLAGGYQTGESVSIKGNYIAYTCPLTCGNREGKEDLNSDKVKFEYWNPLVLVSKFNNNMSLNVYDKRDYFYLYNKETTSRELNLGNGGITINGTAQAIGAIIHDDEIDMTNLKILDEQKRRNYSKTYDLMTEKMGDSSIKDNIDDISTQIDFTSLENDKLKEEVLTINDIKVHEICYQSNSEDIKVWLHGKNKNVSIPRPYKKINLTENSDIYKGLIIVKGDVYISGDFTLYGTIITDGNIYIDADSKVNIIYDENHVLKMIYKHNLQNKFRNNSEKYTVYTHETTCSNESDSMNIRPNELVKFSNWQISY